MHNINVIPLKLQDQIKVNEQQNITLEIQVFYISILLHLKMVKGLILQGNQFNNLNIEFHEQNDRNLTIIKILYLV